MMTLNQPTASRPWYRLHATTQFAAAYVAALLLVIVVPGEVTNSAMNAANTSTLALHYAHGWPSTFLRREDDIPRPSNGSQWYTSAYPSWFLPSAWSYAGKIDRWDGVAFVLDVTVFAAIVIATSIAVEVWRRRRRRATEIGMRDLLGFMLAMALVCVWLRGHYVAYSSEAELRRHSSASVFDDYCGPEWLARLIGRKWPLFHHVNTWFVAPGSDDDEEFDLDISQYAPRLSNLEAFWCDDQNVTPQQIASLGACPRLCQLVLRGVPMSRAMFAAVATNVHLNSFSVTEGGQFESAAIGPLRRLPYLTTLEIGYGTTSDGGLWAEVAKLELLESLTIRDIPSRDDGMNQLANLKHLTRLSLGGQQMTDEALAHLASLQNLESLDLRDSQMSGAGLCHLTGLSKLSELDLYGSTVEDEALGWIAGMESLERLDLGRTKITDRELYRLHGLKRLIFLAIANTATSPLARQQLQDALPNLDIRVTPWNPGPPF